MEIFLSFIGISLHESTNMKSHLVAEDPILNGDLSAEENKRCGDELHFRGATDI